jgi:hypothetical protein
MNVDFAQIGGPHQSKRENFEELVSQLLALEVNAQPVDGAGGDKGIDSFYEGIGGLCVFQAKFFLQRLHKSQRSQIAASLRRAIQNHTVSHWTLCVPINLSTGEIEWLQKLAPEGVTLDWWGATKLRTLLSKYEFLARDFFPQVWLEQQFDAFREEIRGIVRALRVPPWPRTSQLEGDTEAGAYLDRARLLSRLLTEDASLTVAELHPVVAVDFSEMYTYLVADRRFLLARPVVDFYIEASPFPLQLLPPFAVELHAFLDGLSARTRSYHDALGREAGTDAALSTFVREFERDPQSLASRRAFAKLNDAYGGDALPWMVDGLPMLVRALQAGKFQNSTVRIDVEPLRQEVLEVFYRFRALRSHSQPASDYIDAVALVMIRELAADSSRRVRLISSSRKINRVAQDLFREQTPLRSSHEYAYFVNLLAQGHGSPEAIKDWSARLNSSSTRLLPLAHAVFPVTSSLGQAKALDALREFIPLYREVLRPVDEMIVAAARVIPKLEHQTMQDLYDSLVQEAELVEGFRKWLERMSEIIGTVEDLVGRDKIEEQCQILKDLEAFIRF